MSIKSVVKVMNFHSLLRVDKSRNKSKKYNAMEESLNEMIDNIMNNRNVMLDKKTLRVSPDKPVLSIYIGSDMGFCGNLNNLVKKAMAEEAEEANRKNIVIGRKIIPKDRQNLFMFLTREEYDANPEKVLNVIEEGIRGLKYYKVNIIYNHYYNSSHVEMRTKQIFPMEKKEKAKGADMYKEDFTFEGDVDEILVNLVVLYMRYSMEIAAAVSSAAENISRQNVTTESLNKIDEREVEKAMKDLRTEKDKQFAKVLDNYTKMRQY